ncbi:PREDICTED: uncharacterized protein LOC107339729 [Acropora digitifera]|uniref:uncharacterized protein LOC107339729 n=1 Tax=Acropora digitifera TaxID=70779 RepID=UPI00077AB91C|nr:PREDICTED: uncharacterized protein LOC107339729 [Acropora digitifera]XP_015760513.1 PREDICTED: uncharacterized protein LOC107339729 [Acropora digitifera]
MAWMSSAQTTTAHGRGSSKMPRPTTRPVHIVASIAPIMVARQQWSVAKKIPIWRFAKNRPYHALNARDEMSAHVKFRCIYARSTCPLGCGLNLQWCQIFLHVGQCREKVMRCSVKGGKQMFRRKEWEEHMSACALSHAKLRDGEIQTLREIIYKKEYNNIPPISLREISTESFQWEVQNFSDYRDGRLLASPSFTTADRLRWRGIWKNSSLFLQLQSAVNPVTATIRVVPMQDLKGAVSLRMTELKEGEMIEVGHEMVTKD